MFYIMLGIYSLTLTKTIGTREEFPECGVTAQPQLPAPFVAPLCFSFFLFEGRVMSPESWLPS